MSVATWAEAADPPDPDPSAEETAELETLSMALARQRRADRRETLARTEGALAPDDALARLEAMRWLYAAVYHVWRSGLHPVAGREDGPALPSAGTAS